MGRQLAIRLRKGEILPVSIIIIMVSAEELLSRILDVLIGFRKPNEIICGYTDRIGTTGKKLTEKPTPIKKAVTVKVRSLGTGLYIALGNEDEQEFRLTAVGASEDVDWIDDLSKVIATTNAGSTGELEWIGG